MSHTISNKNDRMLNTSQRGISHLAYFSHVRRNVTKVKSQNPNLLKREYENHTQSVMEYSGSLLNHLIQVEENQTGVRPNLASFNAQPQINEKMRILIVDFLMCCHVRLKLCSSTLFLALDILNRYSSKFILKCNDYQLIALTALWLSSKYWDSKNRIPNLNVLTSLCCNQYTATQFKEIEWHLLSCLDWSILNNPTPDYFIDLLLLLKNNKNYSPLALQHGITNIDEIRAGALLLSELAAFDMKLSYKYNSSAIALAAITVSALALKFYDTNNWENYRLETSDSNLIKICDEILKLAINNESIPSSFQFKYLSDSASPSNIVSKKLMESFSNYHVELQMSELYNSKEFQILTNSQIDNIANYDDFNQINEYQSNMHKYNDIADVNQINNNQFYFSDDNEENEKTNTSNNSTNISNNFASSPDIFLSSNNDAVNGTDKDFLANSLFQPFFLLPLTPTTPTLFQVDGKSQFPPNIDISRRPTISKPALANTNSRYTRKKSTPTGFPSSSTGTAKNRPFLKTHYKRSSSTMDIDFFSSEMDLKKTHSR
ncbi:hypothetical protein TPHA_0H02890 [Tetrapisispora phaffii CBS 4417]|uniref:Cyclin-like domain-containing protein n=1 Tax=Tetrapisispora phaffii (strain ATCC 24235 / CBS 4417 / NBRC 1672 / NRRL Y-8282 / UCD 70-5) TaxID=1071381 RepID=G8BWP1_TETPH|nr:hypothetical protein TPHA_0H02890 [Tetrapisispora phaffii CBS 4417]CCE64492.1 hypothetical protein TPHA_0H02890 [Tetrapisispora phaffii CBS 4417]